MTYVLLYTDQYRKPCYIQGTVEQLNDKLRTLWANGEIDHDAWKYNGAWEMLGIENGELTPLANVEMIEVPQFEVD